MQRNLGLVLGLHSLFAAGLLILGACGSDSEATFPPAVGGAAGTSGSGGTAGTAGGSGQGGTGSTGGTGGYGGTGGSGGAGGSSGGNAGNSGTAGNAGAPVPSDKVDLLLMVDNSGSLADKQEVLASAVPDLINRLANPLCVDTNGAAVPSQPPKATDACPTGSHREFNPVADMHVGVISSSLGSHGADTCSDVPTSAYNPRMEDMSHLLTRAPGDPTQTIATWQSKGFLFWDPAQKGSPPGDSDPTKLADSLAKIVRGAGQDGCGFESQLEAWYRFLIDPAPYLKLVPYDCQSNKPDPNGTCRGPEGIDQTVLSQRKDFLRADSLVAIMMLTDEDDCSVYDNKQGYLVLQDYAGGAPWRMPRASAPCATDPTSANCTSCALNPPANDPECAKGLYTDKEDSLNLRCYRQKQRFGFSFLNPTSRYVDGLTKSTLEDGKVNPLFCSSPSADGKSCTVPLRDSSQVVLAGVVGVPWQDIAVDFNDLEKGYKPAEQLQWDVILGDPDKFVEPTDPAMIQSIDPRSGTNPITGASLAPPSSKSPTTNNINGHEYDIPYRNDLQYACIFKLSQPRDCFGGAFSCDCEEGYSSNNPLCQKETGEYGNIQYRAKAYPAPRILSVLKGIGSHAVVASICAENTADYTAVDYGYRPAVTALIQRLKPLLK